jgi:F-type H+-transporting ATPase subunit gamma
METLEALRHRLRTVGEVSALVHTMKALSAINIRHYQQALLALHQSRRAIELGLRMVLVREPALLAALESEPLGRSPRTAPPRHLLVLVGADRGMCGPFNERVVAQAAELLAAARMESPLILAVGHRLDRPCRAAGLPIAAGEAVPASPRGIGSTAEAIVIQYDAWRNGESASGLVVVHNRPLAATGYVTHTDTLIPVNPRWLRRIARLPWPTRNIPVSPNPDRVLFTALIRQHLLLTIHQALAESLASEHAARLAAMQVAEGNVKEYEARLGSEFHRRRQQVVDEELLDVSTGYRALTEDE